MSVELVLPRIDGVTTQQQLLQLKSCLFQMREQLQFALNNLDAGNFTQNGKEELTQIISNMKTGTTAEQQTQYQELKALIIKTAHTVDMSYQKVTRTLQSDYLAKSEYGSFKKWAELQLDMNAQNLTQYFTQTDALESSLKEAEKLFDSYITNTNAYIRTGLLHENEAGIPIYGVEIGQKTTQIVDGKEIEVVSDLVSRFTSNRLSFYQGEAEVAYISNQRLYITDAEVTGSLTVGDWLISTVNGFSLQWVGGDENG